MLVVGLGNPGPRYEKTRHNIGFMLVDRLAERAGSAQFRERFHGHYAEVRFQNEKLGLLKPLTFMNDSGRSVQAALTASYLDPSSLLIVHDELDLPRGELRLKQAGGDGGHRGLRSISGLLGPAYLRLRIGIGRPPPEFRGEVSDFVLERFPPAELVEFDSVLDRAVEAVATLVSRGIQAAMNATNQRAIPAKNPAPDKNLAPTKSLGP
ncbi:MAG TPA: aminoacyl-tRNA hydrolase, partial [Polyangiaceae bacterium]|nr:aminoacyl-tRNA hydrolase [Polyangiaceae bacterium]